MREAGFLKNVSVTFGANLVVLGGGLVGNIIFARGLGPHGKGVLTLSVLVPTTLAIFCSLGVDTANIFFIGQKKFPLVRVWTNSIVLTGVLTFFFGAFYFLLMPLLEDLLSQDVDQFLLCVGFLLFPLGLLHGYSSSVLLGLQKIKEASLIKVIEIVGFILAAVVLVAFLRIGVIGGLISFIIKFALGLAVTIMLLRPFIHSKPGFDGRILRKQLGFGLRGHIGNIFQFFNYRLDIYLVNFFLGATDVGIYSVSVTMAEVIWHLPSAVAIVLFPKTASSSVEENTRLTPIVSRITVLVAVVSALVIMFLSKPLIHVMFGKRFLASVLPLCLLLPGTVALSLSKVLASDIVGRGKPEIGTYISGSTLIITVVLDILMIPRYGVAGAALASSVSYIAIAVLFSVAYRRISGNATGSFILATTEDIVSLLAYVKRLVRRSKNYGV